MKRCQRGFTLLEILITLMVITLVLAVSYQSLSRATTALSLRTTGRDILNTLRYAREKAVTEQAAIRVIVNQDDQSLKLTNDFGEGNRQYLMPETVRIRSVVLNGSISTSGSSTLRFLPNGSSDTAAILIESKTGAYLTIVSDPLTGGACIRTSSGEDAS
jgi:prepilin-type N-terminal cleavage/methylation domain-containing protein